MDNDVARIDQHPVAALFALDIDIFVTGGTELLGDVVGHARHMTLRATGGHHHQIGKTGFSVKVDDRDGFTFVIVEGGHNQGLQKVRSPR